MIKRIVYLLLTFIFSHCCKGGFSQNLDSMLVEVNKLPKGDSVRLLKYYKIVWDYQYENLDKALQLADDGLVEAKQTSYKRFVYSFLVTKATILQTKHDFDKSIALFQEAIEVSNIMQQPKFLTTCYHNLGNTYLLKGDYPKALANLEKSIEIIKENKLRSSWGINYSNIGNIYVYMQDIETALKKFKLGLMDSLLPDSERFGILSNISAIYSGSLKQADSATYYFSKLKKIAKVNNVLKNEDASPYYNALFEYLIAFDKKVKDKSELYDAINFCIKTKDEATLATRYRQMMQIFYAKDELDSAINYGEKSAKISKRLKSFTELKVINAKLAEAYKKKGNIEEAYHLMLFQSEINDSIFNVQNIVATRNAEVRNYTKEKVEKNILLEKENRIEVRLKYLYLSLGLLSTIVVGLFFINRKNRAEKRMKESFAKQLLNTQEEERQRIAKDLHDSVGQNILFIKNQMQSPSRNESQIMKSIDIALDEVRNISKDLYPNQLEKYGLASAVQALSEQVNQSTGIFVSSDIRGIDEALSKNVQINFYRIIQEFVNNTIKHANATAIRITTEQNDKELKLTVQDNGKGFDAAKLKTKANSSFGILNMEERIKMLKGKVEIESEIGKGTKSIFTIPI